MAGRRTGEVLALRWAHVDMAGRRIHVRESVDGPLKDDDIVKVANTVRVDVSRLHGTDDLTLARLARASSADGGSRG